MWVRDSPEVIYSLLCCHALPLNDFFSEMSFGDVIFYAKHVALYSRFVKVSLRATMTTTEKMHCLD